MIERRPRKRSGLELANPPRSRPAMGWPGTNQSRFGEDNAVSATTRFVHPQSVTGTPTRSQSVIRLAISPTGIASTTKSASLATSAESFIDSVATQVVNSCLPNSEDTTASLSTPTISNPGKLRRNARPMNPPSIQGPRAPHASSAHSGSNGP